MTDEEWNEEAKKGERRLLWWFRKATESGHGDIRVEVRRKQKYIEIQPAPTIRTDEEQAIFEK